MFTRIINTIRDSISKNTNTNRSNVNNSKHPAESEYSSSDSRRPSVTEELQKDNHSMLTKFSTSQSMPLGKSNSISEPIPIGATASSASGGANRKRRGSSTVFGISNVTYDDYVQKDLISSSWS